MLKRGRNGCSVARLADAGVLTGGRSAIPSAQRLPLQLASVTFAERVGQPAERADR